MARRKLGLYGISNKFRIIKHDTRNNTYELLEFTTGYSALHMFDTGIATRHAFDDGSKAKLPHFIDLEWVVIWDGILFTEDGLQIPKAKNAEFDGIELFIQPDIFVQKSYKVQIIEDKRKLEHYHNLLNTAKSYMLAFENVDAVIRYDGWLDPDLIYYSTADELDFV